jgi:hypothetical protein
MPYSRPTSPEPGWEREEPRVVTQANEKICWAAALESWMSVTPQSPASWFLKTQRDALRQWQTFTENGEAATFNLGTYDTLQEAQRALATLTETGTIVKDADGKFTITTVVANAGGLKIKPLDYETASGEKKRAAGGLEWVAAGVGMDLAVFKPARKLTGAFLYQKLRFKGHPYLIFSVGAPGSTIGHACVVYKIINPHGTNCVVSMMDPWKGLGKIDRPMSELQGANEAVVGWPE